MMESRSRGVLDTPLSRSMTPQVKQRRRRHCEERGDEAIHSFFPRREGLLRCARNDGHGSALLRGRDEIERRSYGTLMRSQSARS